MHEFAFEPLDSTWVAVEEQELSLHFLSEAEQTVGFAKQHVETGAVAYFPTQVANHLDGLTLQACGLVVEFTDSVRLGGTRCD